MIDKAVILARGLGKRMQKPAEVELDEKTREIADKGLKGLIPIDGKPFLDYSLQRLAAAGFKKVCFVIGPEHHEFRKYYSENKFPFEISFAIQQEPRGTADAVLAAREFAGEDSFVMLNSDDLYSINVLRTLREYEDELWYAPSYDKDALFKNSNIQPERINKLGIMVPENGFLKKIIEKPEHPEEYAIDGKINVSMNIFRFTPEIFDFCKNVKPSIRNELELVSAVQDAIDSGIKMGLFPVAEGVLGLTSKEDIPLLREALKSQDNTL